MKEAFFDRFHRNGNYEKKFRWLILGSAGVGKTSLIQRYINNTFSLEYSPTTSIDIYKKWFNFYPKPGENNDYAYIEIVDSVSFETTEIQSSDWYQFFFPRYWSQWENKQPSTFMYNHIKYEYIPDNKPLTNKKENNDDESVEKENKIISWLCNTERKIFTRLRFMAFVFVFDYTNSNSFKKCLNYTKIIINDWRSSIDEGKTPLLFFVANKYPYYLDPRLCFKQWNNLKDKNTTGFEPEFFNVYSKILLENKIFKTEKEAKNSLFIVNTQNNKCVKEMFESIFVQIEQDRKDLWNVNIAPNEDQNVNDNSFEERQRNEREINRSIFDKLFSNLWCCSSRKDGKIDNWDDEIENNYEHMDGFTKSLFNKGVEPQKLGNISDEESEGTNKSVENKEDSQEKQVFNEWDESD